MYNVPEYYTYVILFEGKEDYDGPVLKSSDIISMKMKNKGHMHLLDADMVGLLPAISYCMHMPRTEWDVLNTDVEVLSKAYDEPHNILIMPIFAYNMYCCPATLFIIPSGEKYCELKRTINSSGTSTLGGVFIDELSTDLLKTHWKQLYDKRNINYDEVPDNEMHYFLDGRKQCILPALFMARQHERAQNIFSEVFNTNDENNLQYKLLWREKVLQNALMKCEGFSGDDKGEFLELYNKGLDEAKKDTQINVVITMPGISTKQIRYGGFSKSLPKDEKETIRMLGLHRAIAREAYLIELPLICKELYDILYDVESKCRQGTNLKYIKRQLKQMGDIIFGMMSSDEKKALIQASHITVFSDFPFGLAIFEGCDSPLQCVKSISYRSLSPLTRCMQIELLKHPQLYLGKKCKILFAECIPNDDSNSKIRACSAIIVETIKKISRSNSRIQIEYAESLSVANLKVILKNNKADVLIISAHGRYIPQSNMAGLMIGDEFWIADDDDISVPPIVILSACHASPRGSGSVNVADLFLRIGAEAVLGSHIPISANRNMVLITRLFTYISEAQMKSEQYRTLADAWSGVIATNAILEIADSSPSFKEWLMHEYSDGTTNFYKFAMVESVGKLRATNIYADSITVIREMLRKEGKAGKFENILGQEDYFSESFFYQWIGFPENIFLYNEIFEDMYEHYK